MDGKQFEWRRIREDATAYDVSNSYLSGTLLSSAFSLLSCPSPRCVHERSQFPLSHDHRLTRKQSVSPPGVGFCS